MKIKIIMMLILVIALSSKSGAKADETFLSPIQVYLNGTLVEYDKQDAKPFRDSQNQLYVPVRYLMEKIGAKVTWSAKDFSVIIQKASVTLKIPLGKPYLIRNDQKIYDTAEAFLKDGRVYCEIYALVSSFGCKVSELEQKQSIYIVYQNPSSSINKIPVKYDLRSDLKVSSVKDQGEIGTCWAFASIGALESGLLPGESFDFSEDHISLNHGYQIPQSSGGDFEIGMSYLARWAGPVLEKDDPYNDGITKENAKAQKHVQEAYWLPDKDYQAIKMSVLLYGGVQSSMYFDPAVIENENLIYNKEKASYYYKGSALVNHAVLIVGWDDEYDKNNFKTVPSGNGAFICKNSFGTEFGDDGYFYVSYFDTRIGTESIVYTRIEDTDNYDYIYQTDKLGWVGRLGYSSDTAYFSNVYDTGDEEQELKAISFYATDKNTEYEIYIVKNFEDPDDFKKMNLQKKGALTYKGYYTIDLNMPVKVKGRFAVVVKIKTPDSLLPVAAEYYKKVSWLKTVNISDGEGYMSFDGTTWDSTESDYKSNVCLKAFTNQSQ